MEDEDETSSEEDDESKGLYGLFQLSDRKFCDSGLCPSKNMCHASCKGESLLQKDIDITYLSVAFKNDCILNFFFLAAFTDDDITNDIACVIQTGYWK